jgi:hypothetical protein
MHLPYGMATIEKMALDTNASELEKIRYEARIQSAVNKAKAAGNQVRGRLDFLNGFITKLFASRDKILASTSQDYSMDIDCQHVATPCN